MIIWYVWMTSYQVYIFLGNMLLKEQLFLFADDNLVINIADLDKDAVEAPEITSRLAVCNLDWDRVKAQDIFVLLQSFKPTGGLIKYVKV